MKRLCLAILAILYLSTSIGTTIELHYCMGKFAEGSLWHNKNSKCSKCGMQKKHGPTDNGCCRDEYKLLQIEKDQKSSENLVLLKRNVKEISTVFIPLHSLDLPFFSVREYANANDPPRSCSTSRFIINCSLRI